MRRVVDAIVQAIKNDEKITSLAQQVAEIAREARVENSALRDDLHEMDKRLVRLESFVEIAKSQPRLPGD